MYSLKTRLAGPLTYLLLLVWCVCLCENQMSPYGTITKLFFVLYEFPNKMCIAVV